MNNEGNALKPWIVSGSKNSKRWVTLHLADSYIEASDWARANATSSFVRIQKRKGAK